MAADVQIRFRADSREARREINELKKEIKGLRQHFTETGTSAEKTGTEVQQFGNRARAAGGSVDKLGTDTRLTTKTMEALGTQADRTELEAIAAEARNTAWKQVISKIANADIAIALAQVDLANPTLEVPVGQVASGLVDTGINKLAHFEQTDAMVYRLARRAALSQPRPAPNYLPTPTQLRNAQDIGREVVAGFGEGLNVHNERRASTRNTGGYPEQMNATIEIKFPDGTVQELRNQIVRLQQQGRAL